MPKEKAALQKIRQDISRHTFDTSKYIMLKSDIRRDRLTGNLKLHEVVVRGKPKAK
jgi:hypothetical protein